MATLESSEITTLRTETQLSLLYTVLATLIKPIRPHLVTAGKPLPAGSPRLKSHPKSKKGCQIIEHRHEESGVWLYTFKPRSPSASPIEKRHGSFSPSKHQMLYFAGGGFQSGPSGQHWKLVATMANSLSSEYEFTIVSYPLAPNSPASESLPILRIFLASYMKEAALAGNKVSLMGDSAGGNIVLSLGFWWAEHLDDVRGSLSGPPTDDSTSGRTLTPSPILQNLIVISPPVDHRNINFEIKLIDQTDPLLGSKLTESVSKAWTAAPPHTPSGTSSREHPKISPLLHTPSSYRLLATHDIRVHGVIGTNDILAPDAELFRQRCVEYKVPGDWLVWQGQMHCFVLAGTMGMKEGKKGIEFLTGVCKRNV